MTVKEEIKTLIKTLEDQLKNFKNVPDDRLEAFLDLVVEHRSEDDDGEGERLETREFQIVALVLEADVRNKNNIGHCGEYQDYVWEDGKWVGGEEQENDEEDET